LWEKKRGKGGKETEKRERGKGDKKEEPERRGAGSRRVYEEGRMKESKFRKRKLRGHRTRNVMAVTKNKEQERNLHSQRRTLYGVILCQK
jgi:hypothetical protein